ncbi:S1 family peptidase [Kitasatospora sp. NPDC001660]
MLRTTSTRRRAGVLAAAAAVGALTTFSGTPAGAVVGDQAADGSYAYTAKLTIGDSVRACTGTLVDPYWVLTAASCFSDDPAQPGTLQAGAPKWKTTATIGRTDTAGRVRDVVELAPRQDRDLVLARLASPVQGVAVLPLATAAPMTGQTLRVAGYGRTKDDWVPTRAHTGVFSLDAVQATGIDTTGVNGAAVCKGDTGAPVIRETNGKAELAAVASRSWQGGCLGSTETRTGAYDVRVDDLGAWVKSVTARPLPAPTPGTLRWFQSDDAMSSFATRAAFDYGNAPMIPLAGNWSGGPGGDTAGAYDPTTAHFFLTDDAGSSTSTRDIYFGDPGDQPVVGRWDGGRTTEIGVYRPANATFYLRHHDGSVTSFVLGDGGNWKPVAGDWTHKGYDTPGLFNPATNTFYLVNSNHGGNADITIPLGDSGDLPIAGDWNGSGTTQVGVYRPGNSTFYFRAADGSVSKVPYGDTGMLPVTGDWNGDGRATQAVVVTGR